MTPTSRPAVERVTPPKAPYRVVTRVMRWLPSSPRRSQRVGESAARRDGLSLIYLDVRGGTP